MEQLDDITEKVVKYYSNYDEQARLSSVLGQIEFTRTKDIIHRYLQPPPATVLDVGGAAGRYSCWLAQAGFQVHLVDPVPLHIEQARQASAAQPTAPITSCTLGDARQLEFDAGIADAVLLLGPLYHLVEAQDRHRSLMEAYRVLKPGGHVFTAAISRFASTIDGFVSGYYLDPVFQHIMEADLDNGQHRNLTHHPKYFMEAFFHQPHELQAEVNHAGFEIMGLFAVEGLSYLIKDLETNWKTDDYRQFIYKIIAKIEREPTLLGASPHLLCVGVKS